ncbi:MAG: hypothetical protein ACRCX2_00875 [Paraclostridium sp.]
MEKTYLQELLEYGIYTEAKLNRLEEEAQKRQARVDKQRAILKQTNKQITDYTEAHTYTVIEEIPF